MMICVAFGGGGVVVSVVSVLCGAGGGLTVHRGSAGATPRGHHSAAGAVGDRARTREGAERSRRRIDALHAVLSGAHERPGGSQDSRQAALPTATPRALASRLSARGAGDRPVCVQFDLAHPDHLRGDLHALVGRAELHRLLEVELDGLGQRLDHVGGRRPHVGQLLLPGDVDVEVLRPRVDADDLALVGVLTGFDEEGAAVGQLDQRERRDGAGRSDTSDPVCRARISPAHGR